MKILIADDDVISRCLVQKTLDREGYEVLVVENGSSAAECLSGDEGPRLALLDWVMPGLDGLSVCRQIRSRSNHPYVYMILLTSKESKEDFAASRQADPRGSSGSADTTAEPYILSRSTGPLRYTGKAASGL